MANGHGGKRAGSGRKPKPPGTAPSPGAKSAAFATSITPEVRAAMEREQIADGVKSLSEMAQRLLKEALDARHKARQAQRQAKKESGFDLRTANNGLGFLVAELAGIVAPSQLATDKFNPSWLTDPFLFETLGLAIANIMKSLRPPGEVVSPMQQDPTLQNTNDFWGALDSPENRAKYAAGVLWSNMRRSAENPGKLPPQFTDQEVKDALFDTTTNLFKVWAAISKERKA